MAGEHSIGDQVAVLRQEVEILRAELAELRLRLEMYREAFGEGIGQCGEDLVAHVEILVRKLVNEFLTVLDNRFAALNARLNLVLPDKLGAKDADERDDDVEQLPNPLRRTH